MPERAYPSQTSTFYPWYLTGVLAVTHLVSMVDRNLLGVVLVDLKQELVLSDSQLGLLYGTGFALIFSVIALPLGRLADVRSRKNLIAAGLFLWTLATGATAFADSFAGIFVLRMAVGVGEACLVPAAMSLLFAAVPKPLLARATAIFTTGGGQGRTVAYLVGGPILTAFALTGGILLPGTGSELSPWRAVFLVTSVAGFALVPVVFLLREPARAPRAAVGDDIGAALRHLAKWAGSYASHFGAFTALATVIWTLAAWALSVFVREHGMSAAQAGAVIGTVALTTGPTGNLFGGWILDRLEARAMPAAPITIIAVALAGSIPFAILFALARETAASITGYALLQFVLACANSSGYVGTQQLTPPSHRGIATAVFVAVYTSISLGVGPVLVGLMSDFVFAGTQALSRSLGVVLVGLAAAGAAIGWAGRRGYRRTVAAALTEAK